MTNVEQILKAYLREHGYDGLMRKNWRKKSDCCCLIDTLGWCNGDCLGCEPAYKVPHSWDEQCEFPMTTSPLP